MGPLDGSVQATGAPAAARGVIIFGDSWAEDNKHVESGLFAGVQGWPTHLAGALGLPVAGNFARGQSESSSLQKQLRAAEDHFGPQADWGQYIVVLHSGGNDFIGAEKAYNPFARGNFWLAHCTWGFKQKGKQVVSNLLAFMTDLHTRGCRRFVVSDLPLTSAVPALVVAQVAGVNKRGRWMTEQLVQMLADFRRSCGGAVVAAFVSEIEALNRLAASSGRSCAGVAPVSLFLRDCFHPTNHAHKLLAEDHAKTLRGHEVLSDGAAAAVNEAEEDASSADGRNASS